ncbi:hypothetical protein TH47_05805 [Thalassospira sp. MCCC 1A02803]|nr:hypothetical protein TH47_05805 [Thalassospira sp. MCCC 1A02803]
MDIYKEDIHSTEYLERLANNLEKLSRETDELNVALRGECLRAKNPRVVACHCTTCGGK